jgi:hypothetical protein
MVKGHSLDSGTLLLPGVPGRGGGDSPPFCRASLGVLWLPRTMTEGRSGPRLLPGS